MVESRLFFEGGEHDWLGNNVLLQLAEGRHSLAKSLILRKVGGVDLTFGRIVAMAGDFYTSDSYWISIEDGVDRQAAAFDQAVRNMVADSHGYMGKLNRLLDQEVAAIKQIFDRSGGDGTAAAYKNHGPGFPGDDEFKSALGLQGIRYGTMAWKNFDHFGDDAVTAYAIGHRRALQLAREASAVSDADQKEAKLREAYLNDAFACHFLTDLFSSGHLRVDRRGLHTYNAAEQGLESVFNGVPRWDLQARIMHDDDSATGLRVANQENQAWIAYGDKQLMEIHATVGRYRASLAVQASVDEVFNMSGNSKEAPNPDDRNSFRALKLAPRPMTATNRKIAEGEKWFNECFENSAPLWCNDGLGFANDILEFAHGKNGTNNTFTRRKDVNDHSLVMQVRGWPGDAIANWLPGSHVDDCALIAGGDFKSLAGQFPPTKSAKITNGGFIQWQTLPIYHPFSPIGEIKGDHRSMVNVWSPLICPFQAGAERTFSLRSRVQSGMMLGDKVTGRFLHLLAVPKSSDTTILYEFARNLHDQRGLDVGTSWLTTKTSNNTDQAVDVSNPELLDAQFTSTQRPSVERVNFQSWCSDVPVINMRFLTATLTTNATPASPDLVSWEVNYVQETLTVFDTTTAADGPTRVFSQTIVGPAFNSTQFIKSYKRGLLVVRCGKAQATRFYELQEQDGRKTLNLKREYSLGGLERLAIPIVNQCVLVGDIMGTGSPQMIVTTTRSSKPSPIVPHTTTITWQVFENLDIEQPIPKSWDVRLETGNDIEVPRFYGLAQQDDGQKFLDMFHISEIHSGSQDSIVIRKWTGTDKIQGRVRGMIYNTNTASALGGVSTKSIIPDTINTGVNRPHFISLRFLRCSVEKPVKTDNAIMQVFSLYGILGYRVFGPSDTDRKVYELIAQCPYLGQPSLGVGIGCHGEWGAGILPFGMSKPWVDEAYWKYQRDEIGTWGFTGHDQHIDLVHGWDVENIPAWAKR